jgi:hypothetical protein
MDAEQKRAHALTVESIEQGIRREKSIRAKIGRRLRSNEEAVSLNELARDVGLPEKEVKRIVEEMLPRMRYRGNL